MVVQLIMTEELRHFSTKSSTISGSVDREKYTMKNTYINFSHILQTLQILKIFKIMSKLVLFILK